MAIAQVAQAGIAIASLLNKPNKEDPRRFSEADQWYQQAINGDAVALCRLQYMGGLRGVGQCGGEPRSGFATAAAKEYNEKLYQQALSVLAGRTNQSAVLPQKPQQTGSGVQLAQSIGQGAAELAQTSAAVASQLGTVPATTPQQKLSVAIEWGKWAIVGVGVIAVVFLLVRSRR